jgi:hypothetical protein
MRTSHARRRLLARPVEKLSRALPTDVAHALVGAPRRPGRHRECEVSPLFFSLSPLVSLFLPRVAG